MTSCNHMTFYHLMLDDQLKEALLIGQNAVTWCSPQSNADQVTCSGWRSWWGSGVARNFQQGVRQSVAILSVHSHSAALPSRRYNQKTSWHIIPPEWLNIVCRIRLESIEARLSLTDKNIGTFAIGFTRRPIILRNHTPKNMYFPDRGCICPLRHLYGYATVVMSRKCHAFDRAALQHQSQGECHMLLYWAPGKSQCIYWYKRYLFHTQPCVTTFASSCPK